MYAVSFRNALKEIDLGTLKPKDAPAYIADNILHPSHKIAAVRVRYVFSGRVDGPGNLYILFVYNNRGLHINGRRLATVTLHE